MAIKFANSDHNVKYLNCFPKPTSMKNFDPERKNMSRTKINEKARQVTLNSTKSMN